MASPPYEVDDQTDEDFFDKLVNDDEIDLIGSVPHSSVETNQFDEAAAFSNLSISELDSELDAHVGSVGSESIGFGNNGDSGVKDGVVSAPLDAKVDSVVAKENDSLIPSDANQTDNVGIGSGGALSKNVETEAKEVQWDKLDLDSKLHGGSKYGSYSDLFNELGDNSEDPFANVGKIDKLEAPSTVTSGFIENQAADLGSSSFEQHGEGQFYGTAQEQNIEGVQDLNSSQYWENLYPGWKYDPNTGQWYQLEGYDGNANVNGGVNARVNAQESLYMNSQLVDNAKVTDQRTDAYYLHQTAQSVAGSVMDTGTTSSVSNWSQIPQGNSEYPAYMVFDPQYPGWYYDTIAQEWKQLDSYSGVHQSTSVDNNQQHYNLNGENYGLQGQFSRESVANWGASVSSYNQQNVNMWQPQQVAERHELGNQHVSTDPGSNSMKQQRVFDPSGSVVLSDQASQSTEVAGFPSFNPVGNFAEHYNQTRKEQKQNIHFSPAQFDSQKSVYSSQQPLQSGTSFSYVPSEGRSSVGRPSHALVTFGFGGKLIVMKDDNYSHANSTYGSQDSVKGVINVLNVMEVVMDKTNASSFGTGGCDYFHVLCQQPFPGPLVGGNAGIKELNKWIDDRIANCETPYMDFRRGDLLRLLFSLLKISFQYYGKLRSPFGTEEPLKESDSPESAVAELFASAKRNQEYGAVRRCLQNMPSEAQIQATALEVQKLLVSGRKKEAFEYAKEGQLWGPALVLASQLGDKFYGDTVKQMALKQFIPGSPLRTLCLLMAGQPADVFCNATTYSSLPGSFNISRQPAEGEASHMLHEWEENLAIITANRTKDDELVIIHLGDSLWKEMGEITAAHICYLVAEANFEPYSDSARMCLVGADHWKFPRTYASPEAIQRTELYEYSKVLGNSQFLLLPFLPYKLIYAHMLAEVGKVADALKYCQAILKSLKTGRSHEVETCKQLVLSLEERLRTHQQGGYSTNLAPTKLVGKLLTFFDSTAHRVVGSLPPPVPMTSPGSAQHDEHAHPPGGPKVTYGQSTMAMSSLMPSASMEPISEWTGAESNHLSVPNRSISEPDFGRNPVKADSSKKANSSNTSAKPSVSSGSSRFGRFGSQLFQKTVGLVIRSRPGRQAKLGEANKFYYDEKLKRWVEEGAEPPPEEAALPPPPKTAAFQSGNQDYSIQDALKTERFDTIAGPEFKGSTPSEQSSGIPPIPPSSNQFTARGRMGVRSRYVDTFNKGGGMPTNLFQSPSIPAAKPRGGSTPKFFIPSPAASGTETLQTVEENMTEAAATDNSRPKPFQQDSFSSPPPSTSSTMHRFPSMDNIVQKGGDMAKGNSHLPAHSRRAASWSGSLNDASNSSMKNEIRPLGEALGMPPSLYMPSNSPAMQIPRTGSGSADDLHEVQL
ncbi:hypothetical protein FEM48_Zijuj08G0057000 [Ziziphus jujuba var. spinosa]|uniref:Protein transport protein sec16 n=1 Tax=Ziziphus jujuba var. spinosa TaxID=714518 RepID=A0A978UXA9_ZIZJJ|nr:hypothetical protein FEM48_Zijuj08G0057000 [Ziziphus jujuba var. spinosa]